MTSQQSPWLQVQVQVQVQVKNSLSTASLFVYIIKNYSPQALKHYNQMQDTEYHVLFHL